MDSDFLQVFAQMLGDAIKRNAMENTTVDPERLAVLNRVFDIISATIDGEVKLNLRPGFGTGSVTVRVPEMDLTYEKIVLLKSALSECSSVGITPHTDGTVEFGVTVKQVFH